MDLGLFQKQLAEQVGVSEATIYNWECNAKHPQNHHIPIISNFFGYVPFAPA